MVQNIGVQCQVTQGIKYPQIKGVNFDLGKNGNDTFNPQSALLLQPKSIQYMIDANPVIGNILKRENIPMTVNYAEIQKMTQGHLKETQKIASGIISYLPPVLREKVDRQAILEAAVLHDFGKILIPSSILNKNRELTSSEKKIMDLHSELSYQLLVSQNVNPKTLDLIRKHHQPAKSDIDLQILQIADKYSALVEERTYKDAYSSKKALGILYKEVKNGNINPQVFKSLAFYIQNKETELANFVGRKSQMVSV